MARWTAHTRVAGMPEEILVLLTEPEAISRWTPVPFDLVDREPARLRGGERVRVRGHLAGRALEFDVAVAEADGGHLVLTATGPIQLEVEYHAVASEDGSELRASVAVSGRGLFGRVLAQATDALLASGALRVAVDRLASELAPAPAA